MNPVIQAAGMHLGFGLSVGLLVSLWVVRRTHYRCRYCGNLHRERPKQMNALVFMMTICRDAERRGIAYEKSYRAV